MVETSRSPEGIDINIKGTSVENYTSQGYTPSNPDVADKLIYRSLVNNALDLSPQFLTTQQREDGYTRLAFVPLSSDAFKLGLPQGFSKEDTAVFFAYQGSKADQYSRSPGMRAVAVMSNTDAAKLSEAIKKDPTLAYWLLNKMNDGPIKMYDGKPMEIKPGKAVEILANEKVGGQQKEAITTLAFPPDYKPNLIAPQSKVQETPAPSTTQEAPKVSEPIATGEKTSKPAVVEGLIASWIRMPEKQFGSDEVEEYIAYALGKGTLTEEQAKSLREKLSHRGEETKPEESRSVVIGEVKHVWETLPKPVDVEAIITPGEVERSEEISPKISKPEEGKEKEVDKIPQQLKERHKEYMKEIERLNKEPKEPVIEARKQTPLEAIQEAKDAKEARIALLENEGLTRPDLLAALAKRFFAEGNETEGNRYVDMASQRIKEGRESQNAKNMAEVVEDLVKANAQLTQRGKEISVAAEKLGKAAFK